MIETDFKIIKKKFGNILLDPDIYYRIYGTEKPRPYHKFKTISGLWLLPSEGTVTCFFAGSRKHWILSRLILNAKKGQFVDHRNRNVLDNTRQNLRIVTRSQNQLNRRPNIKTGFYGVWIVNNKYCKICEAILSCKKTRVRFNIKYTPESLILCALARDKMVLQAGLEEYAPLNFPCWKNEPFKTFLLETDLKSLKDKRRIPLDLFNIIRVLVMKR
jgi:hypothetical protein